MKIRSLLIVCCLWWCVPAVAEALTVEEVLLLKHNGVSEATIQLMLQSEIQARQAAAAGETMGVTTIIRPGGRAAIVYSTSRSDHDIHTAEARLKEQQAWEMLRHLIVDTREAEPRYPTE